MLHDSVINLPIRSPTHMYEVIEQTGIPVKWGGKMDVVYLNTSFFFFFPLQPKQRLRTILCACSESRVDFLQEGVSMCYSKLYMRTDF